MYALPEQIDTAMRFLCVYAVVVLLFVFNTVNLSLPISGAIEVPLLVIVIYYWSIYRPTLLPPWLVFVMGVIFDAVSFLPLGMNAFIFLGLRWLVVDQRLFLMGQSYMVVWVAYAVISLCCVALQWFIFGLLNFSWTPLAPAGFMVLSGVIVFPVVFAILHFSHRLLPSKSQQYGLAIK